MVKTVSLGNTTCSPFRLLLVDLLYSTILFYGYHKHRKPNAAEYLSRSRTFGKHLREFAARISVFDKHYIKRRSRIDSSMTYALGVSVDASLHGVGDPDLTQGTSIDPKMGVLFISHTL